MLAVICISSILKGVSLPIYSLENTVQNYEWGSYTAIPELLCKTSPHHLPQAELWMGAHPKSPSNVIINHAKYSLSNLIEKDPVDILGEETYRKFGSDLPYLLKVLAAEKPLSIQVHPNEKQAIAGFNREYYEQKPINSPKRNYKDKNNKIECMCALTPLWGLSGFRKVDEMQSLINMVCPTVLSESFKTFLQEPNTTGLEKFLRYLSSLPKKDIKLAVSQSLAKAKFLKQNSTIFEWVCRLADIYPNEISVFAPVLLNLVKLKPGQAILISQGVPHTYIKGVGIEIMANSDNILRAGLTNKHTNILEFLNVTEFVHQPVFFVETEKIRSCETLYKTGTIEFMLSTIDVVKNRFYTSPKIRSVEILFCTSGKGTIIDRFSNLVIKLKKGDSFLVTSPVEQYEIHGEAKVFKASVPI